MDEINRSLVNISTNDNKELSAVWIRQLISKLNISPDIRNEPLFEKAVNELASSNLENLSSSVYQLRTVRDVLKNKIKSLAAENYHIFIDTKDASQNILEKTSEMSTANQAFLSQITEFTQCCSDILLKTRSIEASLKKNRSALENHTQLLEIIELPQLMQTCVHNGHYDDAISIFAYTKTLFSKYGSRYSVLRMIYSQVSAVASQFVHQLYNQLRAPLSLSSCIKTVVFLRRTGLLSEQELRLKFLQTRTNCLKSQINSSLLACTPKELAGVDRREKLSGFLPFKESHDKSYWVATRRIEVTRVHLFDIVTQYRAVFPDEDGILPQGVKIQGKSLLSKYSGNPTYSINLLKGSKDMDYYESSPNLLHAWLVNQVAEFLNNLCSDLQTMMYQPKCTPQELTDRLLRATATDSNNYKNKSLRNIYLETLFTQVQSLISQSMYFGRSFHRIGCDFRPHLANLFCYQIESFIRNYIDNIVSEFKFALANFIWRIPSDESVQINGTTHEEVNNSELNSFTKLTNILLEFPPLILLYNHFVELFHGLNICCPTGLKNRIIIIVSNGLHACSLSITEIYDQLKEQQVDNWLNNDVYYLANAFCTSLTYCILANLINYLFVEEIDNNVQIPDCKNNNNNNNNNPMFLHRPLLSSLCQIICKPIYIKWSNLQPSISSIESVLLNNNSDHNLNLISLTNNEKVSLDSVVNNTLKVVTMSLDEQVSISDTTNNNHIEIDTINSLS
ncbi:conserved oligomeric Golgi complex component [Schistosoma haematobium]|uniref:Conserved oligomeric Golgi complex subunit 8 n=1 Tax=Schistosoma haematobium TaxID=6185 RepID=A0A922LS51_SCHHA|nr:conserved oligomeric Golgi complex component [Schistosoma haematobium]KAH9592393.1 conserved oligomeric Golgi complex component [Schistosoma haematobium]